MKQPTYIETLGATLRAPGFLVPLALAAFASNSLLTRAALGADALDPASFSLVRLTAGAITLSLLASLGGQAIKPTRADLPGSVALLAYVAGFSFAYVTLDAGLGAIVLFGAVQATIFAAAVHAGPPPGVREWLGMTAAFGGLVYLVSPAEASAPLGPLLSMAAAGVAWGAYTLIGRKGGAPLGVSARSFSGATLLCVPLILLAEGGTPTGFALAALSGAVTSGLGYAVWYAALPRLRRTTAGVAQLAVPPLTALAAWPLLGEAQSARFFGLTAVVLIGIAVAIWPARSRHRPASDTKT